MRPSIPQWQVVSSAFRLLQTRLKGVEKRINAAAAKEMKLGKYDGAQSWMSVGGTVAEFLQRVKAFEQEWKRVVKAARISPSPKDASHHRKGSDQASGGLTPAWQFCEPALKALSTRGGRAAYSEIIADLQQMLSAVLTNSDRGLGKNRGTPKWHNQVQRAYRQCQSEGWIEKEKRSKGEWRITEKGRALAEKQV